MILFSTEIMLYWTYTPWSYHNNFFIAFWFLISILFRSHSLGRGIKNRKLVKSTFQSLFFFSGSMAIINMLFFNMQFRLLTIAIAVGLFYFLMLTYRLFVNFVLGRYRAFGGNILNCMIVGVNSHGLDLYNEILKYPELGYRTQGIFGFKKRPAKKSLNFPFLGKLMNLPEDIYKRYDVIFFSEKLPIDIQSFLLSKAEKYNLKANVIPELVDHDFNNFFIKKIESVPYININKLPLDGVFNQFLKRCFDIVFSLFINIFFLSWMIPIFGLLIKLSSKGPIFFIQDREGYKGSYFKCYKFRTMIINSEADSKWADDNDKRLTRIGRLLRLTAIDEMPQFINVLFGDMSVVGPRPHMVNENKKYLKSIDKFMVRHFIKPGITGLAQVNGYRGEIETHLDIVNRIKYDINYIENWSFLLDIKIIILTVFNSLRGEKKAY